MQKMLDIPYHLFFSVGEFSSDEEVEQLQDLLQRQYPGSLEQMSSALTAIPDAVSEESLRLAGCAHRGIVLAIQRAAWLGRVPDGFTDLLGRKWESGTDEALGKTLNLVKDPLCVGDNFPESILGKPETPSVQTLAFLAGFLDTVSGLVILWDYQVRSL